ncbi:DUF2971 domain-containing protein [Vibrio splendidus]|uniref:DUF2971 domain-containing protein n=1 Tax=Vibrio splendidus TaxID=29497 RepID=UPI001E3496FA|nr:DUF2971 domain-containing protein [Vibrio splendidus]MCC4790876.1 DUF2971 domain-containing protein [Vibrio splendidus]
MNETTSIVLPKEDESELDNGNKMFNLAIDCINGEGCEPSVEKAIEYYIKSSEQGNSRAMFNLALHYDKGNGVEQSTEKAIEYYQRAAELGSGKASYNLAVIYKFGEHVERSIDKAIKYYKQASELGSSKAMYALGVAYLFGEGVTQSYENSNEYFHKAAELGHRSSIFALALSYEKGEGVERSPEKSVEYYKKAAELGHDKAMFNLALSYKRGEGVEKSPEKMIEYYEKAVALGNASAMFNLALAYENGEAVEESFEKSVEYYSKAVELGHNNAMFNLAVLTREGKGCEQNQTEAEKVFQRLYEIGDNDALIYIPHPSLRKYVYPALTKYAGAEDKIEEVKRAFAVFQDAVIDVMESCEYQDQKAIYHFTRWPAIQSILPKERSKDSRNVIRLYHEDYMNDPSEGKSLDTIIHSDVLADEYHDVANFMGEILELRSNLTQGASTYMASFTKSSDRLDLWRAYGSDGDGFCLKINIPQAVGHIWSQAKFDIDADVANQDEESTHLYKLYNVQYKPSEKQAKLEELLNALKPLNEISVTLTEEVQTEIKKTIFYMLGEVVYLFKDEQYSSEKEVRMFQRLSLNEVCIDESEVGKLYKPTGPILFTGEDSEIIIGPKVEKPRIAELSLLKRLEVNGFHQTKVTHSNVKYR